MSSFHEYRRRAIVPLILAVLGTYYLLVLMPLGRKADKLEAPLEKAWQKLAVSLEQTNTTSIDFLYITNQLAETRQALALLETARKQAVARLEVAPAVRARMNGPFQLVEYENERGKQMDGFMAAAKAQQITLAPGVISGFPQHTFEVREPSLLWPALAFTESLLDTAIRCKVATIDTLKVPLTFTNPAPASLAGRWAEIPIEIEFTAPAPNAMKVIHSLPLRAEEVKTAGLPEAAPQKTLLLIERLVIKKQNPEKLDEVRVWLRVQGFVRRD